MQRKRHDRVRSCLFARILSIWGKNDSNLMLMMIIKVENPTLLKLEIKFNLCISGTNDHTLKCT